MKLSQGHGNFRIQSRKFCMMEVTRTPCPIYPLFYRTIVLIIHIFNIIKASWNTQRRRSSISFSLSLSHSGLPHKIKDMEIERNSKQAEIEIVRNELDKYKTEMESLEKENRKLENKIQRQLLQASPKPEDEANFAVSGLLE